MRPRRLGVPALGLSARETSRTAGSRRPGPATKRRRPEGITVRHARRCAAEDGGRCRCQPAYQAQVFSPRDRRTIRKSFPTLSEARAWRADTKAALRRGTIRAPTRTTLEQAADDWLCAARAGIVRTRYLPCDREGAKRGERTTKKAGRPHGDGDRSVGQGPAQVYAVRVARHGSA